MRELALHLLDIAENSISARAKNIIIEVAENTKTDRLHMSVQDDGIGMDAETVSRVVDPFFTTRTTRKVGLGIPLLKAAAEACNGYLRLESTPGHGTRLDVEFQNSHIDRMPLGDLPGTILPLVVGSPNVHWVFKYSIDNHTFVFDDEPIKKELDGISLTEPDVLAFLRDYLKEGITDIKIKQSLL